MMCPEVSTLELFCWFYSIRKYHSFYRDIIGINKSSVLDYIGLEMLELIKAAPENTSKIKIPEKLYSYLVLLESKYFSTFEGECHGALRKQKLRRI